MFKIIKELFQLLTPFQRRRLYALQLLVVFMAFMEIVGIASIGPFMALVANMELLETNALINRIYRATGFSNPNDFLFLAGVGVLIMLGLASIISIFTTWRLSIYSMKVGTEIADRLYQHYLNQNWLFHTSGSSAQLIKQISTEAYRVMFSLIVPALQMNSRLILALFISIAIISYNPTIAIIGLLIFFIGYLISYTLVKKRLRANGIIISTANTNRFRLMHEGFGGIKDLLLMENNKYFIDRFEENGKKLAYAQGSTLAFSQVPRFFMELVAFSAMIILILVLLKINNGVLSQVLPVLSVYALAGFKLLPALQQIYGSIATIKGSLPAFESIKPDLIASQKIKLPSGLNSKQSTEKLPLGDIELNNISFTYPQKKQPALHSISLHIAQNSIVGFVGESGSGKTTIIDIILSLIQPQAGELKIGDIAINPSNQNAWKKHIGYVPQNIFLSEGSIVENIAFGIEKEEIILEKVKKAASLARLDELINSLENGLNTKVGERGVQLSGGQRQRIGIARALYNNPKVLVFDEATSALDGITEKYIMDAILDLSGQRTIIMIAHRLKTVKKCHKIFMLDKGKLIDQGNFEELIQKNKKFKEMARHA